MIDTIMLLSQKESFDFAEIYFNCVCFLLENKGKYGAVKTDNYKVRSANAAIICKYGSYL